MGKVHFHVKNSLLHIRKKSIIDIYLACMLGTQMNNLIETKSLKENSIVRIDRVMVNAIDKQNGR
jgi:hypothetical protein